MCGELGCLRCELTVVRRAGGSLAEVPGVYQNSDILLLKQASHIRMLCVRVVVATVRLSWCASVHYY